MLFCSTVVGLPFLIPPMLVTGELFKAWSSCSQVTIDRKYASFFPHNSMVFACSKRSILLLFMQHPYVYGVLVFEAMATFIGQVSVLSLIALFGAATTAMVHCYHKLFKFLAPPCQFMQIYIFTFNKFHSLCCAFKDFHQCVEQLRVGLDLRFQNVRFKNKTSKII